MNKDIICNSFKKKYEELREKLDGKETIMIIELDHLIDSFKEYEEKDFSIDILNIIGHYNNFLKNNTKGYKIKILYRDEKYKFLNDIFNSFFNCYSNIEFINFKNIDIQLLINSIINIEEMERSYKYLLLVNKYNIIKTFIFNHIDIVYIYRLKVETKFHTFNKIVCVKKEELKNKLIDRNPLLYATYVLNKNNSLITSWCINKTHKINKIKKFIRDNEIIDIPKINNEFLKHIINDKKIFNDLFGCEEIIFFDSKVNEMVKYINEINKKKIITNDLHHLNEYLESISKDSKFILSNF